MNYRNGNQGPGYIGLRLADLPPSRESLAGMFFWRKPAGGVINDYIGYGTTLTTWYLQGKIPMQVCALAAHLRGMEVEDNVVVTVKYDNALCQLEATWTALSTPPKVQP